ncbi:hypothetical protein EJ08DRAFT_730953 [Tothia fuscella]|uniref:Uncharacterized protein n=1 Tax=Tothia fuscella TaxID=1048955 RepID=A0A9P4NZ02_9PEZI|nr:hypothetical protein EJ08DRAFT_730953 [Tothia fuscella]
MSPTAGTQADTSIPTHSQDHTAITQLAIANDAVVTPEVINANALVNSAQPREYSYRLEEEFFLLVARRHFFVTVEKPWAQIARELQSLFHRPNDLNKDKLHAKSRQLVDSENDTREKLLYTTIYRMQHDDPAIEMALNWIESGKPIWEKCHSSQEYDNRKRSVEFERAWEGIFPDLFEFEDGDDSKEEEYEEASEDGEAREGIKYKVERLRHGFGKGVFVCKTCGNQEAMYDPSLWECFVTHAGETRMCTACNALKPATFLCGRGKAFCFAPRNPRTWVRKYGCTYIKRFELWGREHDMIWVTLNKEIVWHPKKKKKYPKKKNQHAEASSANSNSPDKAQPEPNVTAPAQNSAESTPDERKESIPGNTIENPVLLDSADEATQIAKPVQKKQKTSQAQTSTDQNNTTTDRSATSRAALATPQSEDEASQDIPEPGSEKNPLLLTPHQKSVLLHGFGEGFFHCQCSGDVPDWCEAKVVESMVFAKCMKCEKETTGNTLYICYKRDIKPQREWFLWGTVMVDMVQLVRGRKPVAATLDG